MFPAALPFLLLLLGPATAALLTPLHQFPNGTSVENLAIRPNGAILLTLLYSAQILQIAPPTPNATTTTTTTTTTTPVPALIHSFPNTTTRVNGIAELTPDTYAIAANHNTIWTLDLTRDAPTIAKAATIPAARFLNGVATLNATARTVLVADSSAGVVWRVDTATGRYGVALRDDTLAPPANVSSGGLALGVNGVRYDGDGGYVYYTNTGKGLFCRVKVDGATGEAVGAYETIVEGFAGDDFAVGDGAAFVASSGSGGVVEKVWFGDGAREVVAGGGLDGATSVAFGRGEGDKDVLYVTTSGGGVGGGKVVAVQGL
ncbi:hypothetical protein BK809_0000164 [Diplodia seriata]|uniref:Six-bladed beta-propellerlike protein n=1 Tax=Diplodia seriata TaxID=420778 RepID=A0A1S8B9J0_9PEZI|nr:hypothetical protein BK809_0000164 [Diplodia seriata]